MVGDQLWSACMGGGAGGGGAVAPSVFAKFLQNHPFLPQILAFLCLHPLMFQLAPALSNSNHHLWLAVVRLELSGKLGTEVSINPPAL